MKSINATVDSMIKGVKKHSPVILTAIGITGMFSSVILAIKATPKALKLIENKKIDEKKEKLTVIETVKTAGKCYIPVAVTSLSSAACLIGATYVNLKRNAVLATICAMTESAMKEYSETVLETIGEKKEQLVRDNLAKKQIERNPVSNSEVILTEKGNTLFRDSISGRYFKSDLDKIEKIKYKLNNEILTEGYVSLNDYYYEIGLGPTDIGDVLGWGVGTGQIDLTHSAQITETGEPCIVIDHRVPPKYNFMHV